MANNEWLEKADLSRFTPRERILVIVTATSLAIFLLVFLYFPSHRKVLPLVKEHEKLSQEVMGLERQLEEAMETSKWIKARTPPEAGDLSDRISKSSPEPQKLFVILQELNRLAKATAVEFLLVRPETLLESGMLMTQSVMIDARSTFMGVGRYLQMLESLPRMINIYKIKIETDSAESSEVLVHLYLTVYLEKE